LACEGLTCLGEETCTISGYSNHYFDNEDVSVGDYSYIDANSNVVASITDGYYILSDGELMAPVIFEFVSNQVASILTCPSPTNPPTATATQVLPTGTPEPTPTATPEMALLSINVIPQITGITFGGVLYTSDTTISVVKNQEYNAICVSGQFYTFDGTGVAPLVQNANNIGVTVTGDTATLRALTSQPSPLPTPTGTSAPAPTGTPAPTATPAPTGTPAPTSAPTGTPAPTGTSTPIPTSTSAPNPTPTATSDSAPMTVTIYESGSNVVMSASGTVDLSGLTLVSSSVGPFGGGGLGINNATFVCGANGSSGSSYSGFTSVPSNFGSGSGLANSSGTGQAFGVIFDMAPPHLLIVPTGYTSGGNISSTQTFNNTSLSTLGLTNGTYTYTWSGGSIDVVVGGTPGPTGTPAPTSSGAGWNLFVTENTVINQPPLANGEILFYTTAGGPPRSTYNPNAAGANYLMIYKMDSAGMDYSTQFTNLQDNGGTINITQNGNTATYVANSGGQVLFDPAGFLLVSTALQTATVASPFTYSDTITLTFS
jgi:hypothetical protein